MSMQKRKKVNKNEQTGTKGVKTGNGVRGSGGAEGAHTRQKGKSRKRRVWSGWESGAHTR